MALIFDVETNGFLAVTDRIHCLAIRNTDTGEAFTYNNQGGLPDVAAGLTMLAAAAQNGTTISGHNVIAFDIPAIQKVYPWFTVPASAVFDTFVAARLLWTDTATKDVARVRRGMMPAKLMGRQSLKAWGYRLGEHKGDFEGPWDTWTPEMETYCAQDVAVTAKLYALCVATQWPGESMTLEHEVQWIIARQVRNGFAFDQAAAAKLYSKLVKRRLELDAVLMRTFAPLYISAGAFVPKKDNKARGYTAGVPLTKVVNTMFNPSSRDHVALWFKHLYGWTPTEFTSDGKAKIDETVLGALQFPEAKLLAEYFMVQKRVGQVAEGKQAWLQHVTPAGRIHGAVDANGAVTGRMTHFAPNIGQTPANDVPYGEECRACFVARPGWVLVGCDADALELRDLAGYLAAYDGGSYIATVLRGDKKLGTDMHTVNCRALGMDPLAEQWTGGTGRDVAKTWFYAFIYGAGDAKLGYILTGSRDLEGSLAGGKRSRASFLKNLAAMGQLVEAVKRVAKERKWLRGLDGRRLHVRALHAALNTLLQAAGAIQMKKALVLLDNHLKGAGLGPGVDYEFCANVHDEWQIECRPEHAERIGSAAADSIRRAGEHFGFACPLAANYSVGKNWAETH